MCDSCGKETAGLIAVANGGHVCDDCKADHYFICDDCNEVYHNDLANTVNHGTVCESCYEDYYECYHCHTVLHGDDLTTAVGELVCSGCLEDHYYCCEDCGECFLYGDCYSVNGRIICPSCYDSNYFCCDECGNEYHNDDYAGDGMCENCNNRDSRRLHNYSYKPPARFFPDYNGIHFGLEIEMECRNIDQCVDLVASDLWYCKSDSSIEHGLEAVSHPATLDYWRSTGFEQFKECARVGARGWYTYTCGMHVHVGKNHFSNLALYKLLAFFSRNPDFVLRMSGRKDIYALNRWAAIDGEGDLIYKAKTKQGLARYSALNLCPSHTVEFRIFRSTLNPVSILRNVEFCDAMVRYCAECGLRQLTPVEFTTFVKSNRKQYKNLLERL